MLKKLLLLSFIEGAAVMAAELCGAKLLAPIFGSSLYVWASVMGITLAALALGYFFGGSITEKYNSHQKNLYRILIAAALLLLLMPVISYYLVPRISYMAFLPAVVISTMCLLFFPVFFLGASSPLFIVIQTTETISAGKVSGTVYAVSTFGGILATFLCGFYMIPDLGLNVTLLIFGGVLFVSTVVIFKLFKAGQLLLFAGFIYLNLQFVTKSTSQLMNSDSVLGHLEVEDVVSNGRGIRLLKINNIIQTEMDIKTGKSVSAYIKLLDTLIPHIKKQKRALVLGSGGGLTANLLFEKNYYVTAVEFDNRIIEASNTYFGLTPKVDCVCEDARYYLNHCDKKFGLVLVDIFKAEEQPSHVLTSESLEKLKNNLSDSAVIMINWHGYTNDKLGMGTSVLYNTLVSAGFVVTMTSLSNDQDHRNIIFIAEKKLNEGHEDDKLTASLNLIVPFPQTIHWPYQIFDNLPETHLVNTDNEPVLEKYNALANKTWRSNYLRFYQQN